MISKTWSERTNSNAVSIRVKDFFNEYMLSGLIKGNTT